MMFLKLLSNMRLIFVIATALTVNGLSLKDSSINLLPRSSHRTNIAIERLPDNVLPMHYDIKFSLYINEDNYKFDGECSVQLEISKATKNISLHAKNLKMNEAMLVANDSATIIKPVAHIYNDVSEIMVINFNDSLSVGLYILNMKFIGIINSNGTGGISKQSYENEKGEKVWLVVTHFQPNFARYAFPCWDEPALKATFNISIRHHGNYIALSNMPASDLLQDSSEDGMFWTKFEKTPIMSTYLVAFVVADYVRVSNGNGKINVWCRSELVSDVKFILDVAEMSEILMTQFTNYSAVVPKMDHVVVSHYPSSAKENWGLIIYKESFIVYDEEWEDRTIKFQVKSLVAHEMAHQWFGNLVSPKWWSYVWLKEGFASYFEYHMQVVQHWRIMNDLAGNVQNHVFEEDIGDMKPVTTEINSPEDYYKVFSISVYKKAPVILRMLQHIVSNDVFGRGIFKYVQTHQFDSASPNDLWNAMQIALDESDILHDAYELKDVMDTWMSQKKYPVVTVTRNYNTGEAILSQECFLPFLQNVYEKKKYKWWIPISFTTHTNFNFSNTVPTYWLRPQDNNITINGIYSDAWLIVNLQRTGYYLVNYDDSNWQKISNYLNSDEHTNIHPLNRAQIIFDSFQLLKAGQFNVTIFKDIVKYFKQELNHIPWYSIAYVIEYVHEVSKYADKLYLKHELLNALNNIIVHIGYEEEIFEEDLTRVRRAFVLKWACIFGNYECIKRATDKLVDQLIYPDKKFSPDLQEWIYCTGMMKANATVWNKLLDEYVKKPTPIILYYLSCSENPDILINFLYLALSNHSIIQEEMCKIIYEYVLERHADKDAVLDYILITFEILESRIGTREALNILKDNIIKNVHSEMRINKIILLVNRLSKRSYPITLIQQEIENRLSETLVQFASIHRLLSTYKEI